jgi:hypothetical protein
MSLNRAELLVEGSIELQLELKLGSRGSWSSKFERVEGSARLTRLGNAPLKVPSSILSAPAALSSRS